MSYTKIFIFYYDDLFRCIEKVLFPGFFTDSEVMT